MLVNQVMAVASTGNITWGEGALLSSPGSFFKKILSLIIIPETRRITEILSWFPGGSVLLMWKRCLLALVDGLLVII